MERFFHSLLSLVKQTERRFAILLQVAPNLQPPPAYLLSDVEKHCQEYFQNGNTANPAQLDLNAVVEVIEACLLDDRAVAEQHLQWAHACDPADEHSFVPEILASLAFRGVLQSHNDIALDPLTAAPWLLLIKQAQHIKSDLQRCEEMLTTSQLCPEVRQISLESLHSSDAALTSYLRLLQLFEQDFQEWQIFYWQSQFALQELQRITKDTKLESVVGKEYFAAAVLAIAQKIFRAVRKCENDFGEYYPKSHNLNYREELLKLFDTKSGSQELANIFLRRWRLHREYQRALRQQHGTLENFFATELPGLFAETLAPVPLHDNPFRFSLDFEKIPASIKSIANQLRRLRHIQYASDSTQSALALENAPSLSCGIETWIAQEEASAAIRDLFPKLTRREQEVFALRAVGLSQKQIAVRLNIGFESVNYYLDNTRKRFSGQLPPSQQWRKEKKLPARIKK